MALYKLTITFPDSTVTRTFDDYDEARVAFYSAFEYVNGEGGVCLTGTGVNGEQVYFHG